ncbi:MAG: gamma-glutamyl-gamma-aminobutyrate hydrolase family protein [Spirochaetaceae bacterium]|nr:gamma-glutamyl-gamma-aminobutyrate hydrolase family protein [Spirochaetaceae bacterium]
MKKIALTQRLIKNDSYYEIREALDINWGAMIQAAGLEPVVLPLKYDYKKLYFDGVILTGGNDLASVSGNETDKLRDDFENALLDFCVSKQIPVFGVCRGMQLINVHFGGSIKQIARHTGCSHILDNGMEVNSYHGFAVDSVADGFEIIAKSGDGIIEITRHKKYKIYAQMYHPERYDPFRVDDLRFLREYFNAS